MNTLDELLSKYSWPTKNPLDDTDFVDIEKTIGFELPEDYKDFLSKYVGHETQIGQESFKLWNKKDLISLNEGYAILENLSRTIAIGDNGGGEFIGLEKSIDGGLRVILTPFIDLDEQYHIEIGSSFTDFILRMDKGEKWFKDVKKKRFVKRGQLPTIACGKWAGLCVIEVCSSLFILECGTKRRC